MWGCEGKNICRVPQKLMWLIWQRIFALHKCFVSMLGLGLGQHCSWAPLGAEIPQRAPELGGIGITIVGGRWEESFESAGDAKSETSLALPTQLTSSGVSLCPGVKSNAHTAPRLLSQSSYCCHLFFAVLGFLGVVSPFYQNINFLGELRYMNAF